MDKSKSIEEVLMALQEREDLLRAEADRIRARREIIEGTLTLLDDPVTDTTFLAAPISRTWDTGDSRPTLDGLVVDFTGTKNLSEKIIRIAKASNGHVLNVTQVTKLLISRKQYNTTVSNWRPSVDAVFRDNRDLYEKVGPANYLYKPLRLPAMSVANEVEATEPS